MNYHGPDAEKIRSLFGSIAQGYDRANDVMTFGMARRWRRALVRWSGAKPGDSILDCATGTGDLAMDFKDAVGTSGKVIGSDFCPEMLDIAPSRAAQRGLEVTFEIADAMKLPYADKSFDVVSIAYGIRNVSDPVVAMCEMARVCKSGGRVMILETGDHQLPVVRTAMRLYFQKIVPRLGGWVTGRPQAYEYLSTSSLNFPAKREFLSLMNQTRSFASCEYRTILGGASFMYRGVVK